MTKKYFMIWDIDGALYNYHRLPNGGFDKLCDEVNAQAACELLPHLSHVEGLRLSAECFERFHDCYGAFMPLAVQSGFNDEQFRLRLFKRYHALLFDTLTTRHPDFFHDDAPTTAAFHKSGRDIKHGTLSHSCMEGWGMRILDRLGILPFFEPQALLGLDQYGFTRKFESTAPVKLVLKRLKADPAQTFFIEDSIRNLEPAAEIKGLRLIYIHNNKPLDNLPPFVSHQFSSPAEFMHFIQERV